MRTLASLAICASLLAPAAAFAKCDVAEQQKLNSEMIEASHDYAKRHVENAAGRQALAEKMLDMTTKVQEESKSNPEKACEFIRQMIEELKK